MDNWRIHFLNANDQFGDLVEPIRERIGRAKARAEKVTTPVILDFMAQVWPGRVIPQVGFVGYAPTGTMIQFTFDPANPNMVDNIGEPLERMVVHELHHVLRWRSVGYGQTPGEAIVSEGLAGRFCEQLYNSEPEQWEKAQDPDDLSSLAEVMAKEWEDTSYNHERWFFGSGGLPYWAGYRLGYALVGRFLKENPTETPASLIATPAVDFLPTLARVTE